MNIAKYKTVPEWYEDSKKQGYSVPLQMCHCLSKIMEKYNFSFPDAYRLLDQKGKIILKGKTFFFDLSANELWQDSTPKVIECYLPFKSEQETYKPPLKAPGKKNKFIELWNRFKKNK